MALPEKDILKNASEKMYDPTKDDTFVPNISLPRAGVNVSGSGGGSQNNPTFDRFVALTSPINPTPALGPQTVTKYSPLDVDTTGRYDRFVLGADNEDLQAGFQSSWAKAANGLTKGLGIAGTTFLEGTVGLVYGLGAAAGTGKLSKFYNNDFSNYMADLNESMEVAMPNYYGSEEREANWYDRNNIFTANFFFDKIIKNLGFSVGALASGAVVGGLLAKVPQVFNISKAGMISKLSEALETGLKGVPQIERAAKAKDIILQNSKLVNAIEKMTAVERGIIAGLGAATEGGIEALQGLNEYRDKLIAQHKERFGQAPIGDDLDKINRASEDLGNVRLGLNMLLLSATNYIHIPRILGSSYRSGKNALINSAVRDVETGLLKSSIPTKGFAKVVNRTKNIAGLFVSPTEGFEEGAQFAIEKGVQSYYNKKDYNKDEGLNELIDNVNAASLKGIESVSSKEGMESILIGAISGGIQQAGLVGRYKNKEGKTTIGFGKTGKIGERGFAGEGGEIAKNTQDLISQAKAFTLKSDKWLNDTTNSVKRAVVLQGEFESAVNQGDILEAKDKEFDYQHNYLLPRVKYGRFDLVMDDIKSFRKIAATEEGFDSLKEKGIAAELDTRESFLNRLNSFETHAKAVNSLNESLNLRYATAVTEDGKKKYSDVVLEKMVYAAAKISDYDQRVPQLTGSLLDANVDVQTILDEIILNGTPSAKATKEALATINKVPGISDIRDELKRNLKDIIELGLRRKEFIDEYDDIKQNPSMYEGPVLSDIESTTSATVKQQIVPEGETKKKTVNKELEIGKEYSLAEPVRREGNALQVAPKIVVLSKTLGGEYEVSLPNGETAFMTPQQFKGYQITDIDNTSTEIDTMLNDAIDSVLSRSKYSSIDKPTENKVEFVNSLNNKGLIDDIQKEFNKQSEEFLKKQAEARQRREIILRNKANLDKTQQKIQLMSGQVGTRPNPVDLASRAFEEARKLWSRLYRSTITASSDEGKELAPHVTRLNEFFNNAKNFKNRNQLKAIMFTSAQEAALKIEGLAKLSFDTEGIDVTTVNDVKEGFVGIVFVDVDKNNKSYFVDKNGNRIGEVNVDTPNLNELVFTTMPAVNLYYRMNGKPRHREGQEKQAIEELAGWQAFREQLFKKDNQPRLYKFNISRGIPVTNKDNPETNFVSETLVPEEKISTTPIIKVSTKGVISFDGDNIKVPNGRPVIDYGDTLQYLNNTTFSKEKAETIFNVLNAIDKMSMNSNLTKKEIQLNERMFAYLQNVLYWREDGPTSNNKVYFDTTTAQLVLGEPTQEGSSDNRFDLGNIENNKDRIVSRLQQIYHNVNDKTLSLGLSEPFYEFYMADNQLKEAKWKNYQTYLLSNKGADGKTIRSIKETPLNTSVSKKTDEVPYNYKQKYAILEELDFPKTFTGTPSVAPSAPVVDESVKDYAVQGMGNLQYTATPTEDGKFAVSLIVNDVTNATVSAIVANPAMLEAVKDNLRAIEKYVPGKADRDYVIQAAPNLIEVSLIRAQAASAPAAPTAPVVSDIEAKKADIEKRRREELKKGSKAVYETGKYNGKEYNTWIEVEEELNAKYDAELAALEGNKNFDDVPTPEDTPEYRMVGSTNVPRISEADLAYYRDFMKKVAPNLPFEVLDNMIEISPTEQAWGAFEKGVIKFAKSAQRGTEYHELGEAVWKGFLSPEQQAAILAQERTKKGEFTDNQSGKKYTYADASVTDKMLKERIMDDYADFRVGKLPARNLGDLVRKFFKAIVEFVKSFGSNPSLKEQLFKDIDTGKFANRIFPEARKNDAAEYSAIPGMNEQLVHEFVQDITARMFQIIFRDNKSLFNLKNVTAGAVFGEIKDQYTKTGRIKEGDPSRLSEENYEQLVQRTINFLRVFRIELDDNSIVGINDGEANRNDYASRSFSIDFKKSSPYAIKLLLGTLIETQAGTQLAPGVKGLSLPKAEISTNAKGYTLVNYSQAFATVINKLTGTKSIEEAVSKLYELAKEDSRYVRLFSRLGGNLSDGTINFKDYAADDWRLFINFYQVFTKQKPDAIIQYLDNNFQTYSGLARQMSASESLKDEWIEDMQSLSTDPTSIVTRDVQTQSYNIDMSVDYPVGIPSEMISFLAKLGIDFPITTYNRLTTRKQKDDFADAVSGIKQSLKKSPKVLTLKGETLDIGGHLTTLAELYTTVNSPSQESTTLNAEGELQQVFDNVNAPSIIEDLFNSSNTLAELKEKMPQLNDIFSVSSKMIQLDGPFWNADGTRIKSNKLKLSYISGIRDKNTNTGLSIADLSIGQRFTLEINQNINGNYYVLVPADGSTEWMMNLGNSISFKEVKEGTSDMTTHSMFQGYLRDDIGLAQDAKNRSKLNNVGDKANELRFFKDILTGDTLLAANQLVAVGATPEEIDTFIEAYADDINLDVDNYIETSVTNTIEALKNNNEIVDNKDGGYSYKGLDNNFATKAKINKLNLTGDDINNIVRFVNTNYIINNIEYHKFIFGDPYQFKIKDGQLDETKRIKSFLSPRRVMFDSPELNAFMNNEYNTIEGIELTDKDYGYHQNKEYARTFTAKDIIIAGGLPGYGETNEADASSWIMDGAFKEVKYKNGQWPDEAETWHQWQMAYTRNKLAAKGRYTYSSEKLQKRDAEMISKDAPVFVIEVLKPIVSGNKFNKNQFDLVLDKFSQMPMYYQAIEGTNLEELYIKMFEEGYDYAIVESGRKVGSEGLQPLYKPNGDFNTEAFNNTVDVPWSSYGIQVENSYAEKLQTRGSQVTKIATVDLYDNGVATPEAAAAVKAHKEALDNLHANGYAELLNEFGIEDLGTSFFAKDKTAIAETLRQQMLKRELSQNALDSITIGKNGQFNIPLEASSSYIQIKNILYSIIDKRISSPKVNGFSGVQISAAMWEDSTKGRGIALKTEDGYKRISKDEFSKLSKEEQKNVVLINDTLKFYTKEEPWCEILLPNWVKDKFDKKKFPTDEKILEYLNRKENQAILRGIGFRIPSQAMSSIESFKVKGFLPKFMGASVVVPSEITTKAGSDFDIDKLNMYLKSVYRNANGDVKLIEYLGSEQATKDFYANVFDAKLEKNKIKKAELFEAIGIMINGLEDPKNLTEKYSDEMDAILKDINDPTDAEDLLMKQLEKLGDKSFQAEVKDRFVRSMYTKSLENEYYQTIEDLLSLPENFNRLTKPNDDKSLKKLATKLGKLRGEDESTIPNRMLDRNYMTETRHAFITAKRWVGIGAVNTTGHSLAQQSQIYVDPNKFAVQSEADKKYLGDGSIALDHNTVTINDKEYISLSGRLDRAGKYISDKLSMYVNAFVDVSKDPYILKIIGSNRVVGTFMFLERIGVPIEQVGMFMNQPIIKEYISYLDSKNLKGIFRPKDIQYIGQMFPTTSALIEASKINVAGLEDNIETYYKKGLSETENAEQHLILREFLKYAKMAEFSFKFTQAINYDTTKFKNADELYRKLLREEVARNKNIISSVDKVLQSTFLGDLAKFLFKASDSLGAVLKFNEVEFRGILENVIRPYALNQYLSDEKYAKITQKAAASFLDYVIQINKPNIDVKAILVDDETALANKLVKAKNKNLGVKMINDLIVTSRGIVGGAKSVKLRANLREAYDENLYTGYMREMRDNPETADLYKELVTTIILQGTYTSPISLKNIIPIEDYAAEVSNIMSTVTADKIAQNFATNNYFQRNNWNDSDVVPRFKPQMWHASIQRAGDTPMAARYDNFGDPIYEYTSPSLKSLGTLPAASTRKILYLNDKYNSDMVAYDVIAVPRILEVDGDLIDYTTGNTMPRSEYGQRKKVGDITLNALYGYQKVKYTGTEEPLTLADSEGNLTYVYKLINLYGDSPYASVYPAANGTSAVRNATARANTELTNDDVIAGLFSKSNKNVVSLQPTIETQPVISNKPEFSKLPSVASTPTMTYAGIGSRQTPPEVLKQMTEVAKELESKGYTLNTGVTFGGKKEGADKAFDDGTTKKNLFSPENQGARAKEQAIAKEIHPNPNALTAGALKLMARNTNQVFGDDLNTPVDFVLFYAKETKGIRPEGGTGQAVEMARLKGIPAINLANPNWRVELDKALEGKAQPAVERTYTARQLASMDAKALYKQLKQIDSPSNARGLALEYIANGGTISPESLYNEVLATRDVRLVPTKQRTKEEANNRDYVKKGGPSIKEVAHFIWENLNEEIQTKVDDQDVRNELIEVVGVYNKRLEVAKEYIASYSIEDDKLNFKKGPC